MKVYIKIIYFYQENVLNDMYVRNLTTDTFLVYFWTYIYMYVLQKVHIQPDAVKGYVCETV